MKELETIVLTIEQKKNLPLVLRSLYSNKITCLDTELKLYRYDSKSQAMSIRAGYSTKPISKMILKG